MVVNRSSVSANRRSFPRSHGTGAAESLRLYGLVRPALAYLRDNEEMAEEMGTISIDAPGQRAADYRLRKHADYQRVYREGRKQFSPSMSYFVALRAAESPVPAGPRIGLTAGKVLGKAVERNRIKRRMRDIVRRRAALVHANVDIVLHPRRSVLTMEFANLESEVIRIFTNVQAFIDKGIDQGARPVAAKRVES